MKTLASSLLAALLVGATAAPVLSQSKSALVKPSAARAGLVAPNGGGSLAPAPVLVGGSDTCATPDVIVGSGPFVMNNTSATTGTQGQAEPLCNFFAGTAIIQDVWFTWTAGFSGFARLDFCGPGNGTVDTKVAIYNGVGCPTGAAIACNDDACASFESTVDFAVSSGQSYTIQIGMYPGSNPPAIAGIDNFTITQLATTPNDDCASALPISGAGPHSYDTTNATTGTAGQSYVRCAIFNTSAIAQDVWFRWTATSTGWVAVNTCVGGQHDMKMAVYQGGGCPTGEPLVCDDDGCGTIGANARAPFMATAGQQYLIQIGSYPVGGGAGPGFFTIDPFTPAVGDECSAPIVISGLGPHVWDTTNGTTGFQNQAETLCAIGGDPMITYDLWYRWTSNCTGQLTATMCNQTAYDAKIGVYAASTCPAEGSVLACDDDGCGVGGGPAIITFSAVAGQTYLFQVGMWPGETPGAGTFTIQTPCPPPVGTPICFGDGTGTPCPCGNSGASGNGCASSVNASGGNLAATGVASLSGDTVALLGTGLTNTNCLYFQGTAAIAGGLGATFGDGLRCAGGTTVRLKTVLNVNGASQYPQAGDPPVSVRGLVTNPDVRHYQIWYRNAAAFCTPDGWNLTNALTITWAP
jgi:hypothetical protein